MAPPTPGGFARLELLPRDEPVVRRYELPEGKLAALTALMARDDVPILIRPLDCAIEVRAPERQQMIFESFVAMLDDAEDVRSYHLPHGKLEGLTRLMSRPDVPVLIEADTREIRVHGNALVQAAFEGFVNMIDPHEPRRRAPVGFGAAAEDHATGERVGAAASAVAEAWGRTEARAARRAETAHVKAIREIRKVRRQRAHRDDDHISTPGQAEEPVIAGGPREIPDAAHGTPPPAVSDKRVKEIREQADELKARAERLRKEAQNLERKARELRAHEFDI